MYFLSKVLTNVETRYTDFEKIALALKTEEKKLRSYFQAHIIVVLTNHSIRVTLYKPDTSSLLLKWAVELSEFDIEYCPRSIIKGSILTDFLAKMLDMQPRDFCEPSSLLETNGLSRSMGSRTGMLL